ncbi:hypothetical protein [Actinoplanes flavus]|uniref:Integral membrane protein n=1 Tax=Actinoplanes flavus TaxID=2820290 RepID=A0ABS3UVS4_9ACTN|nr:hypothetical protein [Actinoplanes flavus]MBO3742680.1 hypothetical protein [Actinoplanes flavus]
MRTLRWVLSPVLWPLFLAWRWFTPRLRVDPAVARLSLLRMAAQALTFLVLLAAFGTDREDLTDSLVKAMASGILMFGVAFFGGLAYLNQFDTYTEGWRRIRPAAWRFLSCYLVGLVVLPVSWLADYTAAHPMPRWLFYLAQVPQVWTIMLVVTTLLLIARNFFNAGDVNPLLPALITPWVSVGGLLLGLGAHSRVPGYVSIPISVIGTLATLVLARLEYDLVRRRYRCTLMRPPEIATDPVTAERHWVPAGQADASAGDDQPSIDRHSPDPNSAPQ